MEPNVLLWRKVNRILKIGLLAVLLVLINVAGVIFAKYDSFKGQVISENKSGSAPYLSSPEKFRPTLPEVKSASDEIRQQDALINILLLGNGGAGHPGAELTDTIQVLSIDPIKSRASIISLPRDLYINDSSAAKSSYKLNEAYYWGEQTGVGGGQMAKEKVSEILGIPIHYFMKIDFTAFKSIVDEIGGVDVTVDKRIYDRWDDGQLKLEPGQYHMDGTLALDFARSRHTTSDFDRSARQQKVILAINQKIKDQRIINKPQEVNHLLKIIEQHFNTDIQIWEAIKIFDLIKDFKAEDINSKVIDNNPTDNLLYSTYSRGGAYILLPRAKSYDAIHQFVQNNLP